MKKNGKFSSAPSIKIIFSFIYIFNLFFLLYIFNPSENMIFFFWKYGLYPLKKDGFKVLLLIKIKVNINFRDVLKIYERGIF